MSNKTRIVNNVRINEDKSSATVKFKPLTKDASLVRATARGFAPIFVSKTDKGYQARVRGDNPVAAKSAGQAFSKAVKAHWR